MRNFFKNDFIEGKNKGEQKMTEDMKNLYKQLYEIVNDYPDMTICPSINGSKEARILIVGRCINGWCNIENTQGRLDLCEKAGLEWLKGGDTFCVCKKNGCKYANEKINVNKSKSKSKFWQYVSYLLVKLGYSKSDDYYNQIIWSNLYKASKNNGGNPTKKQREKMRDVCDSILEQEIKEYDPKIVVFITETNKKLNNEKKCNLGQLTWLNDFQRSLNLLTKLDKGYCIFKRPDRQKFSDVFEKGFFYNIKKE